MAAGAVVGVILNCACTWARLRFSSGINARFGRSLSGAGSAVWAADNAAACTVSQSHRKQIVQRRVRFVILVVARAAVSPLCGAQRVVVVVLVAARALGWAIWKDTLPCGLFLLRDISGEVCFLLILDTAWPVFEGQAVVAL